MGIFQLELINYFTYFSTVVPSTNVGWDDGEKIGKIINVIFSFRLRQDLPTDPFHEE